MMNIGAARDCDSKRTHVETDTDASCGGRVRSQSPAGPTQVLVVGGTHPAPIVAMLETHGMTAQWWSGLRHDEFHRPIPRAIALVIVVTDAINHSMLARIRARCRAANVPVMFSRSRKSELHPRVQTWIDGFRAANG
ncbi:MAG: DUF2325 domain-containing protein [Deltaproteobacteria bacterium]|nr:DUF2325 domain-containing protein [Nannocystaceae bacterium]